MKRVRKLSPKEEDKIKKEAEQRIQDEAAREEKSNRKMHREAVLSRIGYSVHRRNNSNVIKMKPKPKYIKPKNSFLYDALDHSHIYSTYQMITNDRLICFPEKYVFYPETLFRVFLSHASIACFMDKNGRSRRSIQQIAELTDLSIPTVKQKESELRKKKLFYRIEDNLTILGDEVWYIQSQPVVYHEDNIIAYHIDHLYKYLRREIKHNTAKVWSFLLSIDGKLDETIKADRELAEDVLKEIGDRLNLNWRTVLRESLSYEKPLF